MKKILFVACSALLAASCSTMQVATKVMKQYPVTTAPEDVRVYENGAAAPADAEILGEVTVYDDGRAKTEPWDTTLFRAKTAVSQVGGNGLYIMEHVAPSVWGSSNHQVYGTMLLCSDGSDAVVVEGNPFTESYNQYVAQQEEYESRKVKGHNLYVSANYGRLLSEYDFSDWRVVGGNINNGIEAEVGYEYIVRGGLGFGVLGSMFKSFVDVEPDMFTSGRLGLDIKSIMGTVSFVTSSANMLMSTCFGFGYMAATNKFTDMESTGRPSQSFTDSGPGMNLSIEIAHRFSNKSSLGFRANTKQFTYKNPGDETLYGYKTLGLGLVFRLAL